jgi:two-component system sensor histidine kinase KdpD
MESERLRNTLLAAISHDVRTPLTALIGQSESLLNSLPPLQHEQAASARAVHDEARQLSALVTNLLEMARLQSGQIQMHSDWQSVEEVVGSAIRASRHALGKIAVRTEIPHDLPLVEFDPVLIERILVNLIENAVKYGCPATPEGKPLVISARATPTSIEIKVRDFGPGLPPSVRGQEHVLFEKFTRGQTESTTRGVGLGLAICKAIAEAHRGQIVAAQAAGGGAEFTLTLPRTPMPDAPIPEAP